EHGRVSSLFACVCTRTYGRSGFGSEKRTARQVASLATYRCRAANAGLRPDPTAAGVATVPRTRSHCDSIADGKAGCVCHADRSSPASAHERCRAAAKAAALDTWIEPELFRDGDHGALVDRVEHEDHFVGPGRIEL